MKLRRSFVVAGLAALLAVVLIFLAAPLVVASAVRAWVWYHARENGLVVEIAAVDAPLFRPVVLSDVRVHGPTPAAYDLQLDIARARFGLDWRAIVTRSNARRIRDLSIDGARVVVRKIPAAPVAAAHRGGSAVTRLFSDAFRVSRLQFRFENGGTIVEAHDAFISASEVESGSVKVGDLTIASPLISQRFANLRGATSWQNQRLTLGAITLAPGIDIDALTADFSHAAAHRIGIELNVDVFGGKVRANVMSDTRDNRQLWDIAGTASEISLAQMSQMLAWHEPAAGAIRTCKFTFRGDAADPLEATASIWAEGSGLTFAGRSAETIMLGGSIYNRRLHLEQLYVKQPNNQFTLSGDVPLPLGGEGWRKRDLNADLSANIGDLDGFARLFGANAGEYSGEVAAEGVLVADGRKVRATLSATGEIQLLDARLPDGARVSADLSCNGGNATLRYAQVRNRDGDIGVWGEVAFADLRQFQAKLFPTAPLADVTSAPSGTCIRGVAFAPVANDDSSSEQVDQITINGGLSRADWRVSLHTGGAENADVVRSFPICPATPSAEQLALAARAPAAR